MSNPWVVNGRYAITQLLSDSPLSRVYLTRDLEAPRRSVVLKTLHGLPVRTERQARQSLAFRLSIEHPHLLPVLDFGRVREENSSPSLPPPHGLPDHLAPAPGSVFVCSPYLDAVDLTCAAREFLATRPAPDMLDDWLANAIVPVLEALRQLHDLSLIHYDVKPEHVLIARDAGHTPTHVTLIDLGLSERSTTPLGTRVRGTYPYMAPEVLRDSLVDHRADLYSLGVTLYQALSGGSLSREEESLTSTESLPRTPSEPALRRQSENWPPLADLVPELNPFWSDVTERLLSPRPEDRPPNSGSLIDEIRVHRGLPADHWPERPCPSSQPVGQEREFDYVAGELDKLPSDESAFSAIVVSGEAGVGRRAFVDRVIDLARLQGVELLRVRCRRTDNPWTPLIHLLRQVRRHGATDPIRYQELEALIHWLESGTPPRNSFPDLIDGEHERLRLRSQVAQGLIQLPATRPFVLVVEELHWASPETIEVLRLAFRRLDIDRERPSGSSRMKTGVEPTPRSRAVFLLTIDDTVDPWEAIDPPAGVKTAKDLYRQREVSRVLLKPIPLSRTKDLLREALGPCDLQPQVLSDLHRLSNGNSRNLLLLIRESYHYGYLERRPHGWVWTAEVTAAHLLETRREEEWNALESGDQAMLALLLEAGERIGIAELGRHWTNWRKEGTKGRSNISSDRLAEESLARLERSGWLEALPRTSEASLLRPLRSFLDAAPDLFSTVNRSYAEALLNDSGLGPLSAIRVLLPVPGAELEPLIPRGLSMLEGLHAPASQTALCNRIRTERPKLLPAELALQEATARRELGDTEKAHEILSESAPLVAAEPPDFAARWNLLMGSLATDLKNHDVARDALDLALSLASGGVDPETEIEARLQRAQLDLNEGQFDQALGNAHELVQLGPATSGPRDGPTLARGTLMLSEVYSRQNLNERAMAVVEQLIDTSLTELPAAWQAECLSVLARRQVQRGAAEDALKSWSRSLERFDELHDELSLATVLSWMGKVYLNRGNRAQAQAHYRRSLAQLERLDHQHGVAVAYNNLGLVHKMQDEFNEAERCFRTSLKIWENQGEVDQFRAFAMSNLSDILTSKGNFEDAIDLGLQTLEIRKGLGNPGEIAFSYYRIATIYRTQGDLGRATDYAEKSLEKRRTLGDKNNLGYSLRLLGELRSLRGRFADAMRCFRQSLSNFDSLGNRLGRMDALLNLGNTCITVGLYAEAEDYLVEAIDIADEVESRHFLAIGRLKLARLALESGRLSEAPLNLEEAEQILREGTVDREFVSLLLESARLAIELGHAERGDGALAEAYEHLARLSIVDLSPTYYRLRAQAYAAGPSQDLAVARKLLERALGEARELDLADEIWRLEASLADVLEKSEETDLAVQHAGQAIEALRALDSNLTDQAQRVFLSTGPRAELLRAWAELVDQAASGIDTPQEPLQAERPTSGASHLETVPVAPESSTLEHAQASALARDFLRLQEIGALLATERDLEALLERTLEAVLGLFDAERGFLILLEDGTLRIRTARNFKHEEIEGGELEYSKSIARQVAEKGEIFLSNDASRDDRLSEARSVHDLHLQAIACFPLETRGRRLGVVYLENRYRKELIPEHKLPLVTAFSAQAATALENARLLSENAARQKELERSRQEIEKLNSALEVRVEEQQRELVSAREAIERQKHQLEDRFQFHNILGSCDAMQQIYQLLDRLARASLPVLIEGESGTGKELVARAVHYCNASRRRQSSFVSENCGAIAEHLFESEFFGHVKGSFTGADRDRDGLISLAEGGTLFLDEVHALTPAMQRSLLRVLQEGEYRPVGGSEFLKANVRLLAACNRPLMDLVREGLFREDLYYRLNVLKVELPPLRDRGNDIILLGRHFLEAIVRAEGLPPMELSASSLRSLLAYDFPGNVRELRNLIERGAVLSTSDVLEPEDLFLTPTQPDEAAATGDWSRLPLREAKEAFQIDYLEALLDRHEGVISHAAVEAGITRESLHRLLKKLGVSSRGKN